MIQRMTEYQIEFWRALMAPFADHELSEVPARGSKKVLTYLDKRALSNRLDSICGPHGWFVEYEATTRGYKCRLHILVPMENGAWVFMYKEDGAGFEEMGSKNRETGEFEYDVDNDEKSGYTNAFRRAAQDAWGIGRYLYKKGIPTFLDPNAGNESSPPRPVETTAQQPRPQAAAQSAPGPQAAPHTAPKGIFRIPSPGKPVWGWAKDMEKEFETRIVNGMQGGGSDRGWGTVFSDWNAEQVEVIAKEAIAHIKTLPTYKGQFDHIDTSAGEQVDQSPNASPPPTVDNIVKPDLGVLRKTLMSLMQEHVLKSIGREATATELKAAFGQIASHCPNGAGHMGEVPESLAGLVDVLWLERMIAFVRDQIRNVPQVQVGNEQASSDIPF